MTPAGASGTNGTPEVNGTPGASGTPGAPGGSRHEGGLSVREQIERYRTAFIAVVTMVLLAALIGGYILAHENLKLPGWVPVLGRSYFTLKAEFQTAQAVTPGQGQAVTIAGAKIGEVASVDLRNGVAVVTMKVTPKYALIYHDATVLLRPKTQLQDITIEVNPGSPSSGRLHSGETIPLAQTAPDIDFDEFLAGLDTETRDYLQLLLAGAGEGFKENGKAFSADLKRFDPLARDAQLIAKELESRHEDIAHAIHNFKLLMEAFGDKDQQLADLIQSSNAVFKVFGEQDQNVQSTLRLLPGALSKTEQGLGKIATAFNLVGPTLSELHPFATALAPAEEASRASFKTTTPIFKNDIRPFAHEILPTIDALAPSTKEIAESFPKLASSFSVLNELFNEIAYNPGKNRGGFLFFLDWAAHNLNSVVSSADAHGVLGRSLLYFNCEVLPILSSVTKVNPTVNILVGLLNPPSRAECQSAGILKGASAAAARATSKQPPGGLFSGLSAPVFGGRAEMQKRAPTLGNILVIVLFALSCFGLLLFLWESFGGPVPLKPKGYQFTVAFPRALALAEQSDVRISGVDVGHVVALKAGKEGRTVATLELSSQYAPIRADMHAILRQKTLLGETYVQLIPQRVDGSLNAGPYLPDGARLAQSQVEPSVTLDDILSLLTPKTRADFKIWMQSVAEGITGRGEQINSDFAELQPFAEHGNQLLGLLASQEGAVTALVKNTGEVFDALSERDHQFQGFIVNGQRAFQAFAQESQAFADAFKSLPTFEHSSQVALKELDTFATNTSPLLDALRPAERQLASLLGATKPFAPSFNHFLTALGPLTSAAKKGLPDVKQVNDLTVPLLENIRPVLHNFDPFLQFTSEYIPELQAFFANFTAATQAKIQDSNVAENGISRGPQVHYLRTMQVLRPESLAIYAKRIGANRANPYFQPGAFRALANGGLKVFETGSCADSAPSVSGPANETISQTLIEQLIQFHIANAPETPNAVPAPACNQQEPFTFNGKTSQYPQVVYSGK